MSTPQRPPRGGQTRQEPRSAGLLVEVIRTLTTSPSAAQKELQKQRLEQDFVSTGEKVDKFLQENQHDLSTSLQSFRKVSSQLTLARERVRSAKDSLATCKLLLQCKRDEMKKLWLASAEQKHLTRMLDQIESIRSLTRETNESMTQKLYLRSAELIQTADVAFEGNLNQVEALRETKDIMSRKKQELFDTICNELNRQLYIKPSEDLFYELGRLASMRRTGVILASEDLSSRLAMPSSTKKYSTAYLNSSEIDGPILRDDGLAFEDITGDSSHRESNPVQHIAVLVESSALIRRLPDLVDVLKRRMVSGMASIVHHTTIYAKEYLAGPEHTLADSKLLAELLQLLFRQFKIVAMLHRTIVSQLKRVRDARRLESGVLVQYAYTMNDVWDHIQATLQQVLNDYLDIKNAAMNIGGSNVAPSVNNPLLSTDNGLSSYFGKRRPVNRDKKSSLFRFDSTMHAIKVASYVREQKLYTLPSMVTMVDGGSGDQTLLICAPTPENAIIIFKPLMKFVSEIEETDRSVDGSSSVNLRSFMEDYIRAYYLPKMQGELMQKLEMIFQSGDAHEGLWTGEEAKRLSANVPLLTCTVRLADICRNLEVLMQSAPVFATKFAELWLQVLYEYRRFAQSVYERIGRSVKHEGNVEVERRKISAAWAVDEDISRLLKTLPNWMALTEYSSMAPMTPFSPPMANSLATPMMESAEDIRQRNIRESEILIGNLGMQKRIEEHETILDDVFSWKLLANMHESIQWFCRTMRMYLQHLPANVISILKETKKVQSTSISAALGVAGIASALDSMGFDNGQPSVDDTLYRMFENSLVALDEAAATFLLMLHLEVRVHCFYFLLPIAKQTVTRSHGEEIDEQVVRLNKDLLQVHDALTSNLQNRKVKYVFEGLGHLVSAIFINSTQHITKINDSGKKRMCKDVFSVQQSLSSITGTRESDLDAARRYFELLYKTPDDILNTIVEKGPEFTQLEYQNLLALAIRSHPIYSSEPGSKESRLNRLREIMMERSKK